MPILDEEHRAIEDSTRKAVAAGFSGDIWAEAARQGWALMLVREVDGGLDLDMSHCVVLIQELGRGGATAPVGASLAAARTLSRNALEHPLTQKLLAGDGPLNAVTTRPHPGGDLAATCPRTLGFLGRGDSRADGLTLLDAQMADGCPRYDLLDGQQALKLEGSIWSAGIALTDGREQLYDTVALLTAAEALGLAEDVLSRTVDHLKLRTQFGRPIGSFQVLQHRAADMYMRVQALQAVVYEAAKADGGARSGFAAQTAYAWARRVVVPLCHEAIQMHGALGYSSECTIGQRLWRAMVLLS